MKLNIKTATNVAQAEATRERGTVSYVADTEMPYVANTGDAMVVAEPDARRLRDAPGISSDPDFSWPRLALVHGVGDLANAGFPNGSFVYDKQHVVAAFGQELTFIFACEPKVYWKENLPGPYNPNGSAARVFIAKEQFRAAGLTEEWVDGTPPSVDRAMSMVLLVKKPEEMPVTTAEIELGDAGVWLPCLYDADKSAYREVARLVSTAFVGKCNGAPRALTFGLRCVKKTFRRSGQTANVPKMRVIETTGQAVLDRIRNKYAAA